MWSLAMYSNYLKWTSIKLHLLTKSSSSADLYKVCLCLKLYTIITYGTMFVASKFFNITISTYHTKNHILPVGPSIAMAKGLPKIA